MKRMSAVSAAAVTAGLRFPLNMVVVSPFESDSDAADLGTYLSDPTAWLSDD